MIKIILLILAFGLSTLTTLLLKFDASWKIAVGIVGFGLAYLLVALVIFFGIVFIFCLFVKKDEIPVKYSTKYRKLYNGYQWFLLSLFSVKLTVNGLDKIPTDTNFVMIQNHLSNVDPIFSDFVLRKHPLIFVSKESLFKLPFFGKIVRHIGYVKLTRTKPLVDAPEIVRGVRWIKSGECSLCVYPEGTRNKSYPEPKLLDFKDGSFDFAKKSGKPLLVSVIHGTDHFNHRLLFRIHKVQIDFLEVIQPDEYTKMSNEEFNEKIRTMMLESINNPSNNKEKIRIY